MSSCMQGSKKNIYYKPKSCEVGRMKPFEFLQHLKSPLKNYRHIERKDILHDILAYYIYFLYSPKIKEVHRDWRDIFGEEHFDKMMEGKAKQSFNIPQIETNPQHGNTVVSNGNDQVEDSDDKSVDSEEQKTFSESYFLELTDVEDSDDKQSES